MKEHQSEAIELGYLAREESRRLSGRLARRKFLPSLGTEQLRLLAVVIALAFLFSIWRPDAFATASNMRNMSRQGAVLAIVSLGQMFPLLVGGLDISVGALMGIASTVGAMVTIRSGIVPGVLAGLGVAALLGAVNGLLIARFRLAPFIVTLGMMTFTRGFALQLTNGTSIIGLPSSFALLGASDWGPIPATVGIALMVYSGGILLLHRTRAGLYLYAIGGNEEATRLAGVNIAFYKLLAYTLSGFLAGVAGIVLTSRVASGQPSLGQGFELQSIATAVIGGVAIGGGSGTVLGMVLGVTLMSILTTGMNIAQFSSFAQAMFTGIVIVVAAFWDYLRRGRESK